MQEVLGTDWTCFCGCQLRGEACTFESVYCTINKVPAAVFIESVFEVAIKIFNFSSEFMAEAFRQI